MTADVDDDDDDGDVDDVDAMYMWENGDRHIGQRWIKREREGERE